MEYAEPVVGRIWRSRPWINALPRWLRLRIFRIYFGLPWPMFNLIKPALMREEEK